MSREPLQAHSRAEISLYLMVTTCDRCGRGPLEGRIPRAVTEPGTDGVEVSATCRACDQAQVFVFTAAADEPGGRAEGLYPVINPTAEPSKILDVGQWLTLFRVTLEAASKETDKVESRRLGYEAAQCLDEALKFYAEDNELPPAGALFHEASRARLREHPEQFSSSRLRDMRAKLPSRVTMERHLARDARRSGKRPWWRFW